MEEKEIRPRKIFDKFLRLAYLDVKKYFNKEKTKVNCVACGRKGKFSFKKEGFSYYECQKCKTLFVNPRSNEDSFKNFYKRSSSVKFLSTNLYKKTKEARKKKIFKPRAKMIFKILKEKKIKNYVCVDIGGGTGIFAKEISKLIKKEVIVIEPSSFLVEECKKEKLTVVQKFLENVKKEDLPTGRKVFTCFELIEHLHNPSKFIKNLAKLMSKKDLFIFTTLSGSGTDILALWENSRAIFPPFHINFFNPKSIVTFLKKNKFQILSISTPGVLDIDILENNRNLIKDRFWKTFVYLAGKKDKVKMQNLISNINFSSHMMVICKKQ